MQNTKSNLNKLQNYPTKIFDVGQKKKKNITIGTLILLAEYGKKSKYQRKIKIA